MLILVLSFDVLSVSFISIVVMSIFLKDLVELISSLMSFVELDVHKVNQIFGFLVDFVVLFFQTSVSIFLLLRANVKNIVYRVDNLSNFLRILVLFINLILKVLF